MIDILTLEDAARVIEFKRTYSRDIPVPRDGLPDKYYRDRERQRAVKEEKPGDLEKDISEDYK